MFSLLQSRLRNTELPTVEVLFVLVVLLFGVPMSLSIPPGAGYDEEDHLVRVWELARFSFLPGQMSPQEMKYPTVFRDFAYRQQGSSGILGADFWKKYGRASLYEHGFVRREIDTKSVYSPALLLPQALALRILAFSAKLPALPVFYGSRLASLLSYLLLVWLAIRLIPAGKWLLLVLALVPMALFQAATISPDAISNGLGFLFIAGCLRTAQSQRIGWKEALGLVLLISVLFLAKLNLIALILLPVLLIRPSQFTGKKVLFSVVAMSLILFTLEVAGWNAIAAARSIPLLANEANPQAQVAYVLGHPLSFLLTLARDLVTNGWTYVQGWMNGYGYYYWTPPGIVSFFFLLSLAAVILTGSARGQINGTYRVAFVVVFAAGFLATVVSLYLTFTPPGSDRVFGVQGRYFIPLVLLPCLVLSSLSWRGKATVLSYKWVLVPLVAALTLNMGGIALSFYVPCGSTYYQTGYCLQPLYRDFTATRLSRPISAEISLVEEIQVKCDGLGEVRLLLNPSPPGEGGATRFLLEDPTSHQTLLDTSVANTAIAAETWYPLQFDPDWHSAGKQYLLKISGVDTPAGQGLQSLYTTQPEFDLGKLYENGEPVQADLVLQYGCATGLQKIWLAGRP